MSSDHIIPEAPPSSEFPHHHRHLSKAAGPSRTQADAPLQNVDLSTWEFPENPFQWMYNDLADLQTQYYQQEHITRGANAALNNCEPGNILRELSKRADLKELD